MNPEDLTVNQQLISLAAGIFVLALIAGTFLVHAWVLLAWKRVMNWSGWLRDQVHDRIGFIDLLGCFVFIALAQIAVAGLYYRELMKNMPAKPVPVNSSSLVPSPAWVIPTSSMQDPQESVIVTSESSNPDTQVPDSEQVGPSDAKGNGSESPWFLFAATFSLVLGSAASACWTLFRTKSTPTSLGLTSGKFFKDSMVGVLVFLWVTPLVLMVNIFVSQLTEIQYEHPVIDSLKGRSWAFPLLFASAAIFAPLWEEYAFRFLLVNWLDTLRRHGLNLKNLFWGRQSSDSPTTQLASNVVPSERHENALPPLATSQELNSVSIEQLDSQLNDQVELDGRSTGYPPWWIAIISGILFGLAHFEYGVSWVPLVVLGTVLARVYQLQRSILPCFIIHGLFNTMAMVGFAVELFVKPGS